ncbi:hypothetical protein E2562_033064 [Oryza meyeriana var. granulata]|uniref:Uncharacterized protein n=1 Tax=Oryza meyeriana var. granulata TaxID=110450 RepID=A0A6G1DSA5_9ORYZ|nr:hypothetical protein E2562_033064 [Oryza meyeriana var. granulata]
MLQPPWGRETSPATAFGPAAPATRSVDCFVLCWRRYCNILQFPSIVSAASNVKGPGETHVGIGRPQVLPGNQTAPDGDEIQSALRCAVYPSRMPTFSSAVRAGPPQVHASACLVDS